MQEYKPLSSRRISDLIGTNSDGPRGLRRGEIGHSKANYEQFEDLLRKLLDFDPETRIKPADALDHDFFKKPAHFTTDDEATQSADVEIDMFKETASKKHAGPASRKQATEKPIAQPVIPRQTAKRLSDSSGRRSV